MCLLSLVKVFYVAFQVTKIDARLIRETRRLAPATLYCGAQGAEVQEPFVDVRSSLVGHGGVYEML